MRNPVVWITFLVLLCAAFILTACEKERPLQVGSTVKVRLLTGHGSGVHIGGGYVITVAHVVADEKTVSLRFDDGSFTEGQVLWANKTKDVALVKFKDIGRVAQSPLSCRIAAPGEHVTAKGNPTQFEFLSFDGQINGAPMTLGDMVDVLPADITIIPGMSGGPVMDGAGMVIGLSVGVATVPIGMGASIVRIGLIVSGKTICDLMARGV